MAVSRWEREGVRQCGGLGCPELCPKVLKGGQGAMQRSISMAGTGSLRVTQLTQHPWGSAGSESTGRAPDYGVVSLGHTASRMSSRHLFAWC